MLMDGPSKGPSKFSQQNEAKLAASLGFSWKGQMTERSRLAECSGGPPLSWDSDKQTTQLGAQSGVGVGGTGEKVFWWALNWLINIPQGLHSARSLSDSSCPPNLSPANKHKPSQAYARWGWKAPQGASSVDLNDGMAGELFISHNFVIHQYCHLFQS